jgi:hypothetical protein
MRTHHADHDMAWAASALLDWIRRFVAQWLAAATYNPDDQEDPGRNL